MHKNPHFGEDFFSTAAHKTEGLRLKRQGWRRKTAGVAAQMADQNRSAVSVSTLSPRGADGEKRRVYFVKSFSLAYKGTVENDFSKSKKWQGKLNVFPAISFRFHIRTV